MYDDEEVRKPGILSKAFSALVAKVVCDHKFYPSSGYDEGWRCEKCGKDRDHAPENDAQNGAMLDLAAEAERARARRAAMTSIETVSRPRKPNSYF